jgi:alpha-L-fucosidase 2
MILMRKLYILLYSVFLASAVNGQSSKFYNRSASILVSKYKIDFNEPPTHIPSTYSIDAPLLGNGSTGVAISGAPEKQIFYLSGNDYWRLRQLYYESFPCNLGKPEPIMPAYKDGKYHVEQDLFAGTTYLNFLKSNTSIKIKCNKTSTYRHLMT